MNNIKFLASPFLLNILFLSACVALVLFRSFVRYKNPENVLKQDKFFVNQGIILSYPYEKDSAQIIKIKDSYIKTQLYPKYRLGDFIRFRYTKDSKFVNYPQIVIVPDQSWPVLNAINDFRDFLVRRVRHGLSEPYSGLVLGMTIGYKEPFPSDFENLLVSAGVIHVIVVSGYNVSLLQTSISTFTTRFNRLIYFLSGFLFLLSYLFIVGFEPPIIRAFLMGTLSMLGLASGKSRESMYLLVLSALAMLLYYPSFLTNLSFQFSFVSTFFVVIFSRLFAVLNGLLKEILINIFVGISMYPLSVYYFGKLYLFGILTNILISWVIPLVTIVGFVYLLIPFVLVKVLLVGLISYFLLVLRISENSSGIEMNINLAMLIGIYFILFVFIFILSRFSRLLGAKTDD